MSMNAPLPWFRPTWPVPQGVEVRVTLRGRPRDGASRQGFAHFNLATHVEDDADAVRFNRARLRRALPADPVWLNQVHGRRVIELTSHRTGPMPPEGDAAVTRVRGVVCVVMTADCLPVCLCDDAGSVVAVAHAGWRGLAAGVLEATVAAMRVPPKRLRAWLGPAIGRRVFEVGDEVREAMLAEGGQAASAFCPVSRSPGKWLADLDQLARQRLLSAGVGSVAGGGLCTVARSGDFYSFRREPRSGRFATLIWLTQADGHLPLPRA